MDVLQNNGFGGLTGDVVLVPDAPVKSGKKKWVVIGFVSLIVVMLGVAVVLFFVMNSQNGGRVSKKAFNEYANYVLFGKESDEDFDIEMIGDKPYFLTLNDNSIEQYLKIADGKYWKFEEAYYANGGTEDVGLLKSFYQDYAAIRPLSDKEIANLYIDGGEPLVKSKIKERYMLKGVYQDLYYYADFLDDFSALILGFMPKVDDIECISKNGLTEDCYNMTEEESVLMEGYMLVMMRIYNKIYRNARQTLLSVYDNLYDIDYIGKDEK